VTTQPRVMATAVPLSSGVLVLGHYGGNVGGNWAASRTAELFTLGPVERPLGCCTDSPGFISVSATATQAGRWPTTLVVPAGALEGAENAQIHWQGGSQGAGHEVSFVRYGCSGECRISLSPPFGFVGVMTVQVEITYRGTPPPQASGITIVIDEDGHNP
jgi:hypothetical protein